jgi:hypothetical protein
MGRRRFIVAGALLAMTATAPGAAAQAPAGDAVIGSGTARFVSGGLEGFTTPFQVDLRAGPSGESPTGTLTLLLTFTDPTCLVIRTTPVEEPPTATANLLNPVTGQRAVFLFSTIGGTQFVSAAAADGPDDCDLGPPGTVAEVVEGQISVVDAPPLPTSRAQCVDGGWRSYGDAFRNQGQCVAFVQRGPKA